jgi:ABC-type glycerol-3-phosphate transport system substrate-binding protein
MNFTQRPFQLIFMGVFGVLALLGLVVFSTFSGTPGASSVGNVTIWGILPEESLSTQIQNLKNTHKEYMSVSYVEKPAQTFDTDLAEALASGVGPDLILISQEQLLAEKNKLTVIPFSVISQRAYLNKYLPIHELYLTDTGTYGIPFSIDPLVLFYNRTTLASNGIPLPPTTWEAVSGMTTRLTKKTNDYITKSSIAFGSYENVSNARAILSLLFLQAGSGISYSDINGIRSSLSRTNSSESSTGINPVVSALSYYVQFSDPIKTVYTWNQGLPNSRQAFLAGDLAFYVGFASEVRSLQAGNPNMDFDMTAIPQPQTSATRTTYGLAYAFAVPKASKNPSGAVTIAQALAAEDQEKTLANTLGMAPASRAALSTISSTDKFQAVYFPEALITKGWLSPAPQTTDRLFSTMIGDIQSGRSAISQALIDTDQALNSAYK